MYKRLAARFLGFFLLGHLIVTANLGSIDHYKYLRLNRGAILKGTKPWDKEKVFTPEREKALTKK